MEPIDDILIPRASPPASERGWRARHFLRLLAVLIVVAGLVYAGKLLRADVISSPAQRTANMLGLLPLLAFGGVLWWYAGRPVEELSRPLFGGGAAGTADLRLGARNSFLAAMSVVAIFTGLCTFVFGAILALKREALVHAFPSLDLLQVAPRPFLIIGGILVGLGGLALGLARNGAWVAVSLLAGFTGFCGVALGATLAWHRDVILNAFPDLQKAHFSAPPVFIFSGLLLVLAVAALGLALKRKAP